VTDWATAASLATAGGTLVLAIATFASIRSANKSARTAERAARIAERSLMAGQRPLLVGSRIGDADQEIQFAEGNVLQVPGGGASLDAAVVSARRDPPAVYRGDLLTDLPEVAAQAPREATLVVYHSAVLAYVAAEDRRRFAETIRSLGAIWLSNEAPGVIADISVHMPVRPEHNGAFLLVRDGRTPLAFTDGHGTWLQWLEGPL
jgi:hypothetical protein